MTIGIYALYWEEQGLVYIGQSQNIEKRYKHHLGELSNLRHCNYKLQNAYNSYRSPLLQILEVCSLGELNAMERIWWTQFDNPLNLMETGVQVGTGLYNPNSRHSKRSILKVFICLYKYGLSSKEASRRTKVPRGTIGHIMSGNAHIWLKDAYPQQYSIMLLNANNTDKNVPHKQAIFLEKGTIPIEIHNLSKFARNNCPKDIKVASFFRGLQRLLVGQAQEYRGFRKSELEDVK